MELEVGMYVRTKKGKIYKFETNNSMAKNGAKKYMVNCSYNIIDLIKVGDYVNGEKIIGLDLGTTGETIRLFTSENDINIEDIKSIVTKEQFESMEYKVGDNNE